MGKFLSVQALHEEGVSNKGIARQLSIDVRTVRKYLRRLEAGAVGPERSAVPSKIDPFGEQIETLVLQGLSATQIYQALARVSGFAASYETVKRRVRQLRRTEPEVYCRMRYAPGEEAQIDFGDVGRQWIDGRLRKVYIFVLTLCFSRYAYYELVLDQKVASFLGAIGRAFEYLGGAPQRLKPDNLRAAVLLDRLGQRYYQQDFFDFCQHYGTLPDAARPGTPTDKGRTERDIGYAKGNFFRGRAPTAFAATQSELAVWRDETANVRTHGTTRRRPVDLFEIERIHLRPLPLDAYEIADWGLYTVRKDCHVHVDGNYYSVPFQHVGTKVLVRLAERDVTIFADREQLAQHERARGKGTDVTDPDHYPPTKRISSHEIHRQRVLRIRAAGPHSAQLLHQLREGPWVFSDQLARLDRLLAGHGEQSFERACERALFFGATDGAKPLARILAAGLEQLPLPRSGADRQKAHAGDFGRPLAEYGALLQREVAA
jgi:transposase